MSTIVKIDKRGRLVLPSKIRKSLQSNRLLVRKTKDCITLVPLPDPKSLRGKYKISGTMLEIEEQQEKKVLARD